MRTRMVIDVSDADRYLISRYFAAIGERKRRLATRAQVRKFVAGALEMELRDRADRLSGREAGAHRRLASGEVRPRGGLDDVVERQRSLW